MGLLACAASAGTLGAVDVRQAGATVGFEAPITFECYNSGIIRADEIDRSLTLNNGIVTWALHLDIWNPNSRRWVPYYNSPGVSFNQKLQFGDLEDHPIDMRVAQRRY